MSTTALLSEVRASSYAMKNNKITAEEQDIDKLGKPYSERKTFRKKWLATLCLSGRRMCITYSYIYYLCSSNWG